MVYYPTTICIFVYTIFERTKRQTVGTEPGPNFGRMLQLDRNFMENWNNLTTLKTKRRIGLGNFNKNTIK